jgi:tetratricopeptide (TPR) repeat protein
MQFMPEMLLHLVPHARWRARRAALSCLAGIVLPLVAGCANVPPKAPTAAAPAQSLPEPPLASDQTTTPNATAAPAAKKKSAISSKFAKSFDDAVAQGDAYWRDGDAEAAIYLYVQALSFRPRDFNTLCKLGSIEQKRDNLDLAIRAFELAASVNPTDARVTARLGLLHLERGDDDTASTWLRRSAEAGSSDWRVYDGLGVIESHHSDNAAALQHLQQAIVLAPGVATPLLHRGQALFGSGDYPGAETTLHAAMKAGDVPEALNLLGQIQAKRRAYSEAIDSLLRVLDPPAAYDTLAKLAMANGDNAVALHYFEQAAELSPVYFADAHRDAAIARERLDAAR